MQTQISVRISVETAQALDEYSKACGKSKASIVEQAIKEFVMHPFVKTRNREAIR